MSDEKGQARPDLQRAPGLPCARCAALCCRYYAVEIDSPESADDFDEIRWFLMHGSSWVWADGDEWRLQVEEPCRFLGPANECTIYETRPRVCRDYGLPEGRARPNDPLCDYFGQGERHEVEFRTLEDVDAYARRVLGGRK